MTTLWPQLVVLLLTLQVGGTDADRVAALSAPVRCEMARSLAWHAGMSRSWIDLQPFVQGGEVRFLALLGEDRRLVGRDEVCAPVKIQVPNGPVSARVVGADGDWASEYLALELESATTSTDGATVARFAWRLNQSLHRLQGPEEGTLVRGAGGWPAPQLTVTLRIEGDEVRATEAALRFDVNPGPFTEPTPPPE